VQLEALQRCRKISAQAAFAVVGHEHNLERWNALESAKANPESALQVADVDPLIEDLLGCWRDIYHAVSLYEIISQTQQQLAKLVENRLEDVNDGLAAARAADESLANTAPAGKAREPRNTSPDHRMGAQATTQDKARYS
jgi:hypothetical protein